MSFLLDTCVLSQGIKIGLDPSVAHWLEVTPVSQQFASVISLAEVRSGVERLPEGRRKLNLTEWFESVLRPSLGNRVLDFDESCAMVWAELRARDPNSKYADSQIAATALTYGLTVVTRNLRDFRLSGLTVFNPWPK
jgi:predicted nucleic acid-binding protein